MRKGWIYVIANDVDDQLYVGKTVNLKARWKAHRGASRRGDPRHLYRAMRVHGIERFVIYPIVETFVLDELPELERTCVRQFRAAGVSLYNHDEGGGGMPTFSTIETCEKIRRILKERWSDETRRSLQSERMTQILAEPSVRAKLGKKGSEHGLAKLTDELVRQMRSDHEKLGIGCAELGRCYGVAKQVAWRIIHRLAWTHVL